MARQETPSLGWESPDALSRVLIKNIPICCHNHIREIYRHLIKKSVSVAHKNSRKCPNIELKIPTRTEVVSIQMSSHKYPWLLP